jgi:hypothetical protein
VTAILAGKKLSMLPLFVFSDWHNLYYCLTVTAPKSQVQP